MAKDGNIDFKKGLGALENKGKIANFENAKCHLVEHLVKAGIDKAVFNMQKEKTAA